MTRLPPATGPVDSTRGEDPSPEPGSRIIVARAPRAVNRSVQPPLSSARRLRVRGGVDPTRRSSPGSPSGCVAPDARRRSRDAGRPEPGGTFEPELHDPAGAALRCDAAAGRCPRGRARAAAARLRSRRLRRVARRRRRRSGRRHVIVAVWSEGEAPDPLLELDESAWTRRLEGPFLLWNLALGAAAARCDDGGSIVALVQSPSALDAAGFTPEAAIGDGVVALIRSVAASEGPRGVRANAVTTPLRLVERATLAPAPPLPGYPGRIDVEVAGAIRMLLSEDACGLTGRVLAADG